MELKDIIERIGYFRNKANLSARELSLRIGKHDGYINKLESNDFNLPTSMLLEILSAFNVSPEEFFAENYTDYKQNKEIMQLLNKMPLDKKANLIAFLNK